MILVWTGNSWVIADHHHRWNTRIVPNPAKAEVTTKNYASDNDRIEQNVLLSNHDLFRVYN